MNIYLVGFMGSGKSAISRNLGKELKKRVLDTDRMIVKNEGMSISDIFEKHGERYFRDRETEALRKTARQKNCVISCGGGLALKKENREIMRGSGKVIFLSASPEEIWNRIGNNPKRPLMRGKKGADDIAGMMEERRPCYEEASDYTVQTDGMSIREVCEKIVKIIKDEGLE